MIGLKFGRLTIVSFASRRGRFVTCQCDCGNETTIRKSSLTGGTTTSCGCFQRERAAARVFRHGHAHKHNKTYHAWRGMKKRCLLESNENYKNYGGRGIKVCRRWIDSFESFLADMGEAPDGMSIDRIDNDGDYEPGNCRWATTKEQANNRRTNVWLSHDGKTLTVKQWSERIGIKTTTLERRIQHGWSAQKAIETPVKSSRRATNA